MDYRSLMVSERTLQSLVQTQILTKPYFRERGARVWTIEEIGQSLPYMESGVAYLFPPSYWKDLKKEFKTFICTKDKRYASLRRDLERFSRRSQTAIVSMIAAAMATYVGVAAGILTPFCALCILALMKIGKEAFCENAKLEIVVQGKQKKKLP